MPEPCAAVVAFPSETRSRLLERIRSHRVRLTVAEGLLERATLERTQARLRQYLAFHQLQIARLLYFVSQVRE
jgi:hypothetical protein